MRRWTSKGTLVPCGTRTFRLASAAVDSRTAILAACLDLPAVASHRTAAWLHGHHPCPPRIDVTVPKGRSPGGRSVLALGVRVHSSTNLRVVDTVLVDGIPTTNLARTLLGVAALVPHEVPSDDLVEMVAGAIEARDASLRWLRWLLEERRCRGRNGVTALAAALDARERVGPTDSWLERHMLGLLQEAGLPRPSLQRRIPRHHGVPARVDLLYERQRIVIEVLGYAFHRTPEQISADTMRANELQLQRFTVLQITSRTLEDEPNAAVEIVARALAQAATSPSGVTPPLTI